MDHKKYFIVLRCEYENITVGYKSKYWFQFLEEWNPDTEDFKYCAGGEESYKKLMLEIVVQERYKKLMLEIPSPDNNWALPFYFNSKKEAINAINILRLYGIAEEVDFAKDPNAEPIKNSTFYVCTANSHIKEKVM